jgi:hypothetical protein
MKKLKLIQSDSYLKPYAEAITGRYEYAVKKEKELIGNKTLSDFADGYLYFGLHFSPPPHPPKGGFLTVCVSIPKFRLSKPTFTILQKQARA